MEQHQINVYLQAMDKGLDEKMQDILKELNRSLHDLNLMLAKQEEFSREEILEFLQQMRKRRAKAKELTQRLGKINTMYDHRHISTLN